MKLITKIGLSMAAATTLFLSGCNSQPDQAKADNAADATASATTSKKVVDLSSFKDVLPYPIPISDFVA